MGAPLAGGVALANKATLGKRLRDPTNPLTSSDAYERTSHLQSIASGHQSGGGHGEDVAWNVVRQAKLAEQAPVSSSLLFAGVVAYVNGYTGPDTTDLELKKMIQRQGGMVLFNLSAKCTHILALVRLSGSKEEKFLRMQRNKMNLKVVTPSWVLDSVRNGRRANEAAYAVIRSDQQKSVRSIFAPSQDERPPDPVNKASAITTAPLLVTPASGTRSRLSKKARLADPDPVEELRPGEPSPLEMDEWGLPPCSQRR